MGFFSWFLIIVLIGWILFLYVIPFFARWYLKKLSKKFETHSEQPQSPEKKEGSVTIDYIPEKHLEKDKDAPGDYVNFEDIEEK